MVGLTKIKTEYGEGIIESIYTSELNYTMIKVYFEETKKYITFNLGKKQLEITKDENNENNINLRHT
jgi:hypothetical protein